MAGMFYSLKEAADKLNKSEDSIKELVKTGKLREFRDGANLMFKVDEVNALASGKAFEDSGLITLGDETGINPPAGKTKAPKSEIPAEGEENIFLADDAGSKEDLLNADTALLSGDIKLGDITSETKKPDDLLEETKAGAGTAAGSAVGGTKEDLGLESFGSGGLLDLSLQADDTSLGGILDEIYTAEGGQTPAAGAPAIKEDMLEELPSQPIPAMAVMPIHAEVPPDAVSNALGIMLFIPLIVVIYTAITLLSGTPAFLGQMLPERGPMDIYIIWYVLIGLAVAAALVFGITAFLGRPAAPKEAKPKVEKAPKVKKVKEKKQKEAAPKKQ